MIKLWDETKTKIHRLTGLFSTCVMRMEVSSCKKQLRTVCPKKK